MDRYEAYEELIEEESIATLQPLGLGLNSLRSRFQVKRVSNHDHAKKTALAKEISDAWGKPIPRIMKLIKDYEYQETFDAFEQTKKAEGIYNPWGLFLYKLEHPSQ